MHRETIEAALMAIAGTIQVEDTDYGAAGNSANLDMDKSHKYMFLNPVDAAGPAVPISYLDILTDSTDLDLNWDGRLETNMNGFNETNLSTENPWYLVLEGPLLTSGSLALGFYKFRSTTHNSPACIRSVEYNYDPTIRSEMPPFFPVPKRNVQILEWTHTVPSLPQ